MNRNRLSKRVFTLICVIFMTISSIFAQDAVNKAVELLNRNLILNEYSKAYSYAQFIMKYYADEGLPDEELVAVQSAVKGYAGDLEKNEKWDSLIALEDELKTAPASVKIVAQTNFQHAHDYFTAVEAEKERQRVEKQRQEEEQQRMIAELKRQEQEKAIKNEQRAEKDAETKKIMDLIESQRKADLERDRLRAEESKASAAKDLELEKKRQESEAIYRQQLNDLMTQMNKSNADAMKSVSANNKSVMVGFLIFIFLFIFVVIFLVILSFRQNRHNQEQMKNTILTMQAMRSAQPVIDVLPLPLQLENKTLELTGAGGSNSQLLIEGKTEEQVAPGGSAGAGVNAGVGAEQPEVLKNLLLSCKQYGEQIDKATGRKNVTSQVAELVYKISQYLGYPEQEAIMYFAAALVYDIGFLNIEPSILNAETLSQEQFELLKTHTTIGQNMVFFVDEKNRQLFKDAAGKHHENLDGTGYPQGLKGEQIPYIARVIHVVESYVALISQRQYKEIHDRNYAVEELRSSEKKYDKKIIEALDAIV